MGEPRGDDPAAPRVLRLPRDADGAVGRARADRVHRRLGHRSRPRPQRPAAGPVLGDQRRPGCAGQRGGRARHRSRHRDQEGAPPARPHLPGRHRGRPHRRRRGGQGSAGGRASLPGLVARRPDPPRRPPRPPASRRHRQARHQHARQRNCPTLGRHLRHFTLPAARSRVRPGGAAADARVHGGGTAGHPDPDGPGRRGADRVDGDRHADRRAVRPAAAGVRLLHPAVRAGDQPAAGRDQGGARHLARRGHRAGAEPAGTGPGVLPPDHAAVPGAQRQRSGEDRGNQRRRQPARPGLAYRRRPLRPARRRRGPACPPGRDLRRGLRGDRHRRPPHRPLRPHEPRRPWPARSPDDMDVTTTLSGRHGCHDHVVHRGRRGTKPRDHAASGGPEALPEAGPGGRVRPGAAGSGGAFLRASKGRPPWATQFLFRRCCSRGRSIIT